MAQIMNFKRMEVTGITKEEALAKAPFNTTLPGADCTAALRNYKKAHAGKAFTDADMKEFMLEQLAKKTRNTPGNGCYIVVESAVVDTRERPYTRENVKNEGSRSWKNVFKAINAKTGEVIAKIADTETKRVTKADADAMAKKLYTEENCRVDINIEKSKEVKNGNKIVARYKYTPSKGSREGVYLVFGIENA